MEKKTRKIFIFLFKMIRTNFFFPNMNQCIPAYWDKLTVRDKNLFITKDLLTIEMIFFSDLFFHFQRIKLK